MIMTIVKDFTNLVSAIRSTESPIREDDRVFVLKMLSREMTKEERTEAATIIGRQITGSWLMADIFDLGEVLGCVWKHASR